MNQILRELRAIADRERARLLPEVTDQDLENGVFFCIKYTQADKSGMGLICQREHFTGFGAVQDSKLT